MRTWLRFAMEIGWPERVPTARVRAFKSIEIHTWTESGEVERYTRAAEQERCNAAAMAKQLENKKLANSPGQVGKRLEAKKKKSGVALPRGLRKLRRGTNSLPVSRV